MITARRNNVQFAVSNGEAYSLLFWIAFLHGLDSLTTWFGTQHGMVETSPYFNLVQNWWIFNIVQIFMLSGLYIVAWKFRLLRYAWVVVPIIGFAVLHNTYLIIKL